MYYKKTIYVSIGTMVAAVVNIILNYIFIPKYGFVAAGYTTLASYIILMVVHCMITLKVMKVNIYNNSYLFGALIVTTLAALGITFMFGKVLLRFLLITLLCLIYLWMSKKLVMDFVKSKLRK